MEHEELLNLPTCAGRLGVPVSWLKAQAEAGKIPCLRFGKYKYLFNLKTVKAAIAELADMGADHDE